MIPPTPRPREQPCDKAPLFSHLTEEETEAERGEDAYPRPQLVKGKAERQAQVGPKGKGSAYFSNAKKKECI